MNLTEILGRFDGIRSLPDGRFMARCPAHADKTPSLMISEGRDTITFHCFAGCLPVDVLAAAGLKFSDLYDDEWKASYETAKGVWRAPKVDPIEKARTVLTIAREDLRQGKELSVRDRADVEQAMEVIASVL